MTPQHQIATLEAEIVRLRDVLEATHDIYANASQCYGFVRPENPHNYWPDIDCCTPEEIKAHSKACDDYDAGRKLSDDSWGIGTYSDEYEPAVRALSTPFTPTVLNELVEKVEKLTIERCAAKIAIPFDKVRDHNADAIRALPTGKIDVKELLK